MKLINTLTLSAALMMTACASIPETTKISDSATFKTTTGSVVSVLEEQPNFLHNQSSKAAFGAFGALANVSKGKAVVEEAGIVDPAKDMETSLKSYLSTHSNLTAGTDMDYSLEGEKKPKKLPLGKADYVMDVSTLIWGVNYFPTNWTSYQTYYTGDVTLFDGKSGDIVAQNVCEYKYPETAEESPTYKELMDNDAAMFKANLKLLADRCVEEFKTEALGF